MSTSAASDQVVAHATKDSISDVPYKVDTSTDLKVEIIEGEHTHLSVGDILRGTATSETTLFERKAALINV